MNKKFLLGRRFFQLASDPNLKFLVPDTACGPVPSYPSTQVYRMTPPSGKDDRTSLPVIVFFGLKSLETRFVEKNNLIAALFETIFVEGVTSSCRLQLGYKLAPGATTIISKAISHLMHSTSDSNEIKA